MKYLFTILFTCCFCFILSAQLIEKKGYKKYIIDGETFKKKELDFAFNQNSKAYPIYQKAVNQSKTSRTIKFVSLGLFVAGNGMLFLGESSNSFISSTQIVGLLVAYLFAPAIAIISIPFGISGRRKLKKAIDLHNQEYIELNGYQKDQSHLDLGISTNGMGLLFTF